MVSKVRGKHLGIMFSDDIPSEVSIREALDLLPHGRKKTLICKLLKTVIDPSATAEQNRDSIMVYIDDMPPKTPKEAQERLIRGLPVGKMSEATPPIMSSLIERR